MKNPASVAQGRAAKAAGAGFELWLDAQHDAAKALGVLVHIAHNQPGVKLVGGRLIYTERSGCDYTGLLTPETLFSHGRALAAEAKSTTKRLSRKVIKKKQVEQLDAVAKAGGVAMLLVEFRTGARRDRFAVPWLEVPWRVLRTAASIGLEDMRPEWAIQPGECYLKRGVQVPAGTPGGRRRVFQRD